MNFLWPCYFERHNSLVSMLEVWLFLCQYELLSWIFRIWIFIPQLRRITLKLCQVALRIKILFLPFTYWGQAGIKLGDAWYVSNISIIFDCSMLYYLLFWTLLGFIIHFYIIFGTNPLTGGPAQNCCFLPISVFRTKRISNGVQTEWNLRERDFRNERDPEDLDPTTSNKRGSHKVGGRAYPQARPPPSWAPCCSTDILLPPIYIHVPPNNQIRSQNPNYHRNFLYPRDPILGPVPELRRRGHRSRCASTSTP